MEARMGRRKQFTERQVASFVEGTLARVEGVLRPGEDRTAFFREAVDREIKRRERSQ